MEKEKYVTEWERTFFRIYWLIILFQYSIIGISVVFSDLLKDVGKQVGDILIWFLVFPIIAFFYIIISSACMGVCLAQKSA